MIGLFVGFTRKIQKVNKLKNMEDFAPMLFFNGLIIERKPIKINLLDTFHSLAQRVYENEISMLVEAIEKYANCDSIFYYTR